MEDFIIICDAAEELKKCWKPRTGDRFYLKNDLYLVDGKLDVIPKRDNIIAKAPYYKEGIHYLKDEKDFGKIKVKGKTKWDIETLRKHSFWLPYQEQMQNLLRRTMGKNSILIINFKQFSFSYGRLIDKYSMDALWLLFYYFEVHSKIWGEGEFKKIEKNLIGRWS